MTPGEGDYTTACPSCGRRWSALALATAGLQMPVHCAVHIYRTTGSEVECAPLIDMATGDILTVQVSTGEVRRTGKKVPLGLMPRTML